MIIFRTCVCIWYLSALLSTEKMRILLIKSEKLSSQKVLRNIKSGVYVYIRLLLVDITMIQRMAHPFAFSILFRCLYELHSLQNRLLICAIFDALWNASLLYLRKSLFLQPCCRGCYSIILNKSTNHHCFSPYATHCFMLSQFLINYAFLIISHPMWAHLLLSE